MTHYAAPGWYGKLPSSGDFVKRRFPDTLQRQWSNWFQVGLHHWKTSAEGENAPSRAFLKAPGVEFCGTTDVGHATDSNGLSDGRTR